MVDGVMDEPRAGLDLAQPRELVEEEFTPALADGPPPLGDYDRLPGADWEYRTFRLSETVGGYPRAFMQFAISEQ